MRADKELAKWCAVLAESTAATDTVPPGWLTISELSKQTGSPTATLQHKIRRLIDAGKAERKDFRIRLAKNVRPVPHYRLK